MGGGVGRGRRRGHGLRDQRRGSRRHRAAEQQQRRSKTVRLTAPRRDWRCRGDDLVKVFRLLASMATLAQLTAVARRGLIRIYHTVPESLWRNHRYLVQGSGYTQAVVDR